MKISKNVKIAFGIIAILFIIMFLLYKVSLNIWGAYTVGKVYRISTARGGTTISYEFHIKGKRYGGMITKAMRYENAGHAFFIHYLKQMPSINLLIPDKSADSCFTEYKNAELDSIPVCK